MNVKELIRLSRLTPRWWKCRPRTSSRRKAIKTTVTEEVGVPCVKVDTPDLQPGDEVEVIIKETKKWKARTNPSTVQMDIKEIVKQYLEKGEKCRKQSAEHYEQDAFNFWDGFVSCAENILRELKDFRP